MGQVPEEQPKPAYLIVGNGKLAKHIKYYFNLCGISYLHWHRNSVMEFSQIAENVLKILLLINDDSIVDFIETYSNKLKSDKIWIHCSGALTTTLAECAHPLMTFSDELYDMETYHSIPFITEEGKRSFSELFPELGNPSIAIPSEKKVLYHAWCVISGNFTTILWESAFKEFEANFGIEKKHLLPYMKRTFDNLTTMDSSLTGPLARGDIQTIQKHKDLLKNTPYEKIYNSFCYLFEDLR